MKRIFAAVFSYAAALVGAGFASGQEIIMFFVRYGKWSIAGIIFSAVMFGVFAAAVMEVCINRRTDDYSYFLSGIMPRGIQKVFAVLSLIFALSVVCVMSACFGETLYMMLGIERWIGAAAMSGATAVILLSGRKSALKMNAVIGAVIVIGVSAFGFYFLGYREHQAFSNFTESVVSAVSYPGYNLLTAGAVLAGLSAFLRDVKEARMCAIASAVMMFIMMALMWLILSIYYNKIDLGEIPMLTMALRQSRLCGLVYSVLISAAVITTAVSNGLCAAEFIKPYIGEKLSVMMVCVIGFAFGTAGFSRLIDTAYRWCGYAGIIGSIYIVIKSFKFLKNKEK